MNITIDQEQIDAGINQHINAAVLNALSGWEIKDAISKKITSSVANETIGKAIEKAIEQFDTETLTQALAEQIQITTTKAVTKIIKTGFIEVLMKLQGIPDYDDKKKDAARERLEAEIWS